MKSGEEIKTLIGALRQMLPVLEEKYQVESLGVFGSYVHGSQRKGSDLDLLVTFRAPPSLLKFIELENYLSDFLGVKVDLVMKDALKPRIGNRVLREVMPL
ncbi:MAG: nucleotidyltransferase family protein [Desulfomonilaceae bacterium]|nr:nucleotidyltransferase family protein [Desulfomonilaceae bacterium]